ncbi:MAG: DUF3500 domain-containing protein [Gammaproteobacteria bacterium]|nr:DUF3500 domain-containing protein [Gammaproteobacteria bacterium]
MQLIVKVFLVLVVSIAVLIGLAFWKPVVASRVIWPIIEDNMLDEPFLGLTSDGTIESGLFPIEWTGADTEGVVRAANEFVATMNASQRERLLFPIDDLEWRRWANIHISTRQGVGLLEMDANQTQAAFGLLTASLSPSGLETARNIMRLEGHLSDLMDDHDQYGEKRYWFTIMGTPSNTEPWGWQIDGHHLIINYFVLGDQVVMTPTFMGAEPIRATEGRFAGTVILEEELAAGLALVNSLDDAQRSTAIIESDKISNNNRGELFQDNAIVPYAGVSLEAFSLEQRELALSLLRLYIGNIDRPHAEVKLTEIVNHWNDTRFAWVGGTEPDSVFYYRIHSPVVMIEYDHQKPVALAGPDLPNREHVHTVVRTPNGNDYGKDLLRQHLQRHPH